MAGVGAVLANLLIKWNLDSYILLRIRVITGFLILLYYVTFGISGALLYPTRNPTARVLDAVSDTVLVYVMGAMQAAPFKNQLFPFWALLLVSFRSNVNAMSKYDTYFELTNMLKLWAAALLNAKHGTKSLRAPFWIFWGVLVVKSLYRIIARKLSSKSLWHGRSSELVQNYMGAVDHNPSDLHPVTLVGCKYLVYGESKKNITQGLSPSINNLKSVVSLDSIWQHDGTPLVRTINRQKNTIKDLTLAFALSRLLRCRMEGGRLHEDTITMTREIICSRVIRANNNDDSVLAGILQMDLSFLSQHIHTGYPMVFCQGLPSLYLAAILCVLQLTCFCWLLGEISPDSNADRIITLAAMLIISAMQFIELLRYMSSNWTILLLVCKYVNCRSRSNKCRKRVFEKMISGVPVTLSEKLVVMFTSSYDLLRSTSYSEGKLKLLPVKICLGGALVDQKRCDSVIAAVIWTLAGYMDENCLLPRYRLPSPNVSLRAQYYWSACLQLPSCSHVILVLHIATSLCQVKLEKDRDDTNNTAGLFRLFVRNTKADLAANLREPNTVANCLSRHCLDLLISMPDLLPENVFASKKQLLDTIQDAHAILSRCNSPQSRYDELIALSRLIALAREAAVLPDALQDIQQCGNILMQGAMMGKELIDSEDEEGRWDILAELWAHILVQIAPSSKIEAHKKALQYGAPLVTVVWALLCHCGIEKSELWPEER